MLGKRIPGVMLTLLLVVACLPRLASYPPALDTEGVLHLYLQPIPRETHRLHFSIDAISAVQSDGRAIQLSALSTELGGKGVAAAQRRLATATLPPATYKGISIRIARASLLSEEGASDLLIPAEPLLIEHEFTVTRRRASTLFLSLAPKDIVSAGFRFSPEFTLTKPERQLNSLLGFATNPATNTVSVFNKNSMEVVDTIAMSSGPKGAVLDQIRGWVYVALAGDDSIETIAVGTGETVGRVRLNFGDEPVEIALTPDGETLVSANYGSNSASIVNATSLREVGRVNLPSQPTSVVIGTVSPRAYLLQPQSNTLSAIDLTRGQLTATRILEEAPIRGAIGEDGNSLYVITQNSPDLLVLDSTTLTLLNRIFVGVGAASVKVDPRTGLLYVGKESGEIVVIDSSSLVFIDTFRVGGEAANLAIDNDQNGLFVILPDARALQKLDLVSKRLLGAIDVDEGSYAVVVMGER